MTTGQTVLYNGEPHEVLSYAIEGDYLILALETPSGQRTTWWGSFEAQAIAPCDGEL